ncbi:pteridine transporter [Angomonas deanei]|uniref:BT1 family, putative n=1 Tax=Angomonas deanei TaxID=59799 RepID=A0A7G2C7E0_9TRYP|nr:pteridine transporter [Angomonas deanei]CAD2213902.1 BT1 family, putative [Angomonas deanei]|eukprot:EPY24347.1 pteridine transporter [Angomonas deanei]
MADTTRETAVSGEREEVPVSSDSEPHQSDSTFDDDHFYESTYVHPMAARVFDKAPFVKHIPLFGTVSAVFGPFFTLSLGLGYLLSKGAAGNIINVSRQPMFVNGYGVSVMEYQRLASMYSMGWSVKAFVAVITDLFPFMGYTKRWYLVLSAVLGSVFALAYALLPMKPSSANAAAGFVFLTCFCKANVDILSEGHYSRLMRNFPHAGPSVVSWVWCMTFAGTVISACMMGPLSDKGLAYVGVIVSAVLQFITVFFFIFNLYGEQKNKPDRRKDALLDHRAKIEEAKKERAAAQANHANSDHSPEDHFPVDVEKGSNQRAPAAGMREDSCEPVRELDDAEKNKTVEQGAVEEEEEENWEELVPFVEPDIATCLCGAFEFNRFIFFRNWRLVTYSIIMACAVVTLAVVTVKGTMWARLYTCIVVSVVLGVGAFLCLPVVVAKAAVFMFLNSVLYVQIAGALKNFYLSTCLKDGPHFSYTFYSTVAALITNAAGVMGSVLFASFFSQHKYVWVFVITTVLQMAGSIFDLIIVKRWNIAIGIPDHAMYLMGDSIVYEICFVFSIMPQQILMSRLCPRGTESMSFALLAGISSAGNSLSGVIGSLMMEFKWPVYNTKETVRL